jgi:membrane protein DedA with SNARE-associated domain
MLFAGFDVYQGNLSLVGIIVFGVLGDMIGASIAYAIGYWGREELVERHGNKLHISKQRLDRAHRWFDRWGAPVIIVSRCIPFARAAFPYAAGVARMGYVRFAIFGTIGSIIWITAMGVLGNAVGSNWESWRHHLEYVDYVAAALLVAAIAYLIVRMRSGRRGDPTAVA